VNFRSLALVLLLGIMRSECALCQSSEDPSIDAIFKDLPPQAKAPQIVEIIASIQKAARDMIARRNESKKTYSLSPNHLVVFKHLRAVQGPAFPKEPIVEPDEQKPYTIPQEEAEKYVKETEDAQKTLSSTLSPNIPACERSETSITELKEQSSPGDAQEIFADYLYLKLDTEPSNSEDLFGKGVEIYPYKPQSRDPLSLAVATIGLPCLPFRFRITNRAVYRDTGLNALKNYSEDYSASGKLNEKIKEELKDAISPAAG